MKGVMVEWGQPPSRWMAPTTGNSAVVVESHGVRATNPICPALTTN